LDDRHDRSVEEVSEMTLSALQNRRILVVEDEYLVATSLREGLEMVGAVVVGPAPSVEKALKAIESEPEIDAAILDINLGGRTAYPVADQLCARKIPFLFASGYDDDVFRDRYPGVRNCAKPYLLPDVERALASAISQKRSAHENKSARGEDSHSRVSHSDRKARASAVSYIRGEGAGFPRT
jgi:CheY-like chemotaxis protein